MCLKLMPELINSEKKAAFDFSLPNIQPYIDYVFNNSINHTFESFVSLIFETLWNITERRLEEVKSVIDTMQVDVCCMLDNLEKDITNRLATTYNLSEFLPGRRFATILLILTIPELLSLLPIPAINRLCS